MKNVRKIGVEDLRHALGELAPAPIDDAARVLSALPPPPMMARLRRLGLAPAAAIAGIAVGVLIARPRVEAPHAIFAGPSDGPKLVVAEGQVFLKSGDGHEEPLATGQTIPVGADICTGPEGRAFIRMADGSEVLANRASRFRWSKSNRIHIERGELYTRLERHASNPFEIVSKHGSLQTDPKDQSSFVAQAVSADERELRVVVLRGKVQIMSSDGRIAEIPELMKGGIERGLPTAPREVDYPSDIANWRRPLLAFRECSSAKKRRLQNIPELLEQLGTEKNWRKVDLVFRQMGPEGIKALMTFLLEAPATAGLMEKRLHAAGLIANLAGQDRFDYLLVLLDHDDGYVRERAFIALERLFGEIPYETGNAFWLNAPRQKRLEAIDHWRAFIRDNFDVLNLGCNGSK